MEYGRVYVANFTDYDRDTVVTCNLPLADGMLRPEDNGSKNVTVINPLNDSVNRRCQWRPFGPLYASGYCRNITLVFRVRLAPGTPVGVSSLHPFFGGEYSIAGQPRELVIDDSAGVTTNYALSTVVSQMMPITTFVLTVPLVDNNTGLVTNTQCSLTLTQGNFGQSYDQTTGVLGIPAVSLSPTLVDIDQGNSALSTASLLRVGARTYPELSTNAGSGQQNGSRTRDHSFWQQLLYRLNSGTRVVDAWWWFGNSFATKDHSGQPWPPSQPRARTTNQYIRGDIKLEVYGPKVVGLWETASLRSVTYENLGGTNFWKTTIILNSSDTAKDPIFARYPHFNDGVAFPIIKMSLFYDDWNGNYPLSSAESDEYEALKTIDGESWVTPNATTWRAQQQAYGPFGSVPGYPGEPGSGIPANAYITDFNSAFRQAGNWVYNLHTSYRNRWPYQRQSLGFAPNGGDTAGHPAYSTKLWPLATTGFPDLRALMFTSYLEANRCNKFMEEHVVAVDFDNYRSASLITQATTGQPQRPEPTTDLAYWVGRPHMVTNQQGATPQPNGRAHLLGKTEPRGRNHVSVRSNGGDINESWYPHDALHYMINEQIYTAQITADPGLLYLLLPHHITAALAQRPHRDGVFEADLYNNGELTADMHSKWGWTNSAMIYGAANSRGEARCAQLVPLSLWYVTGDDRLLLRSLLRKVTLYDRPESNNPEKRVWNIWQSDLRGKTDLGLTLSVDLKCINEGTDFSSGPLANQVCYQPWQQMMWPWSVWPLVKALRECDTSGIDFSKLVLPGTATKDAGDHADELEEYVYQLAKAYVDHGFQLRDNGSGGRFYIPYRAIHWFHDPAVPGKALPESMKYLSVSPINPATGLRYFITAEYWEFVWTVGTVILGYEIASVRGDSEYITKFAAALDQSNGGFTRNDTSNAQAYGWDNGYNENRVEYAAVIPEPFKDRSTPIYSLPRTRVEGSTTITAERPSGTWAFPPATVQGSTTITGTPTSGAVWHLPAVTVQGSTSGVMAVPVDPVGVVLFDMYPLPAQTVEGSTTIISDEDQPDYRDFTVLPAQTVSGSTQITRSWIRWDPAIPPHYTYNLVGEVKFSHYLLARIGQMPAKYQTLELFEGNTSIIKIRVSFEDGYDGVLSNVSNIVWVVSDRPNGTTYLKKQLGSGITIVEDGMIEISVESNDTKGLRGTYYHEVYATIEEGKVITLLVGSIQITPAFATV